jgi:hypothetical protein
VTRRPRRLLVAGVLPVLLAAGAGTAFGQAPGADFTCMPAPTDCSGWRTGDVQLRWFFPPTAEATKDCDWRTLTAEGVSDHTCGTLSAGTWTYVTATVRIDRTPPRVTGVTTARPPDGEDGWFNLPVDVAFAGTDAASGIAACTTQTYGGPDTPGTALSGTCRDNAGLVSEPLAFTVRYDATPPEVTAATAARPPDRDGWYTRPVDWAFAGRDAGSGLTGCLPLTFAGPDGPLARVTGTCADRAGNLASRAFPLRYDANPPRLRGLVGEPGDGVARLRWRAPEDATAVRVTRTVRGVGGQRSVVLRRGASGWVDRSARNGRRYRYRITAVDDAGNTATRTLAVRPGRRLLAPGSNRRVSRPPLLRWTTVRRAAYYNVQLFRDGRKVLSAWPRGAELRVPSTWRFAGTRYSLETGRYRWYVWPGYGRRSERRFGRLIGRRSFTVSATPTPVPAP